MISILKMSPKQYLEKCVHMIPNKCAPLIGLLLGIEGLETLLQGGKERSVSRRKLLPDCALQSRQLSRLVK